MLYLMGNNFIFITNICEKSEKNCFRGILFDDWFFINAPAWLKNLSAETKESEIALRSEVRWRLIKGSDNEMAFIAFGKFLIITYTNTHSSMYLWACMLTHTALQLRFHRYSFTKSDDFFILFLWFGFLPVFLHQTRIF